MRKAEESSRLQEVEGITIVIGADEDNMDCILLGGGTANGSLAI